MDEAVVAQARAQTAQTAHIVVDIIGTQVACSRGLKDTWREVAAWTAGQLTARFGNAVGVQYHDMFDADCPEVCNDSSAVGGVRSDIAYSNTGQGRLEYIVPICRLL
jgi:hypothetical protein